MPNKQGIFHAKPLLCLVFLLPDYWRKQDKDNDQNHEGQRDKEERT
jgi:hypothetical protein